MWRLKSQHIKNIYSVEDLKITYDLEEKLILLNGWNMLDKNSNGAGKSSVIDSAILPLFGIVARGTASEKTLQFDKIIRLGTNKCSSAVELWDDVTKTLLEIKWVKQRDKSAVLRLMINGEMARFSTSQKTRAHLEQSLFKFDGRSFTRLHLFRSSNYTQFFALPPGDKAALLEEYITLAPFKTIQKLIKEDVKKLVTKNSDRERTIGEKERFIEDAQKLQVEQLDGVIKELEDKDKDYREHVEKTTEHLRNLIEELKPLEEKESRGKDALSKLHAVNEIRLKLSDDLKRTVQHLEKEITVTEGVKDLKECPTCRSEIKPEKIQEFVKKCEEERAEVVEKIGKVGEVLKDLRNKINTLDGAIENISDKISEVKTGIEKSNTALGFYKKEIEAVKAQVTKLQKDFEKKTEVHHEKIEKEIEDIKASMVKVTEHMAKLDFLIRLTNRGSKFKEHMFKGALKIIQGLMNGYLPHLFQYPCQVKLYPETKRGVADIICELHDGRSYHGLSGGEQRVIDIAGTLAFIELTMRTERTNFGLVFVDEPFTNMSRQLCERATSLFLNFAKEFSIQFFFVSHQAAVWENRHLFDKVLTMIKGLDEITKIGEMPEEAYKGDKP